MPPAVPYIGVFKPGSRPVCLTSCSKSWFDTLPKNEELVGFLPVSPPPNGAGETGKNPTDRAKSGAKIHIPVDERGAPLSIHITGANQHDKWSVEDVVIHIVVNWPNSEQNFVLTKATIQRKFMIL